MINSTVNENDYYVDKLSAERLKHCYEIASPRIQQYLEAEVCHVLDNIHDGDLILELGCGYGRLLHRFAQKTGKVIGIDTSHASLLLAKEMLTTVSNYQVLRMDAVKLAFRDNVFDSVICIQNGISAFHVNQQELIRESIRITKPRGRVFFSSYSEKFWPERLKWFQQQSAAGLLGEIDYEKTRDGTIVCKDGFTATTVRPQEFLTLMAEFDVETRIVEIDESSLFCEIVPL